MSTYSQPLSWMLLRKYTLRAIQRKVQIVSCVVKLQSLIRGFIAKRKVMWLKESLEEGGRTELFNYIKNLKHSKTLRFEGWISEWFFNKGFGFIRLTLTDKALDHIPKDKHGPRLTIFCMRSEFRFLAVYPRGAVNFRLKPNPKFPNNFMATDIIECDRIANLKKPYEPLPTQNKSKETNIYDNCGGMERYHGKIESLNNKIGTGVIKYCDLGDINYHIFFHYKNFKKAKYSSCRSYLKTGQNVSLEVARNNMNPSLLMAVKIIPV